MVSETARVAVGVLPRSWRRVDPAHATKQRVTKKRLRCRQLAMLKRYLLTLEQATTDGRVSTLDSLRLDQFCKPETEVEVSGRSMAFRSQMALTLNLGNSACKDILLRPFVLDRLQHVLNDRFCKGSLLALLGLLLITDPRVQNGLELGSQGNPLLEDERLGLEFSGFLDWVHVRSSPFN